MSKSNGLLFSLKAILCACKKALDIGSVTQDDKDTHEDAKAEEDEVPFPLKRHHDGNGDWHGNGSADAGQCHIS